MVSTDIHKQITFDALPQQLITFIAQFLQIQDLITVCRINNEWYAYTRTCAAWKYIEVIYDKYLFDGKNSFQTFSTFIRTMKSASNFTISHMCDISMDENLIELCAFPHLTYEHLTYGHDGGQMKFIHTLPSTVKTLKLTWCAIPQIPNLFLPQLISCCIDPKLSENDIKYLNSTNFPNLTQLEITG
jgi:hypothetical protein